MKILNYILKKISLVHDKREEEKDIDISLNKYLYKSVIIVTLLLIVNKSSSIKLERIEKEKNYKYYFCFSSMGKLENQYVKEVIEYYKNIGVNKFILGDNNDKGSEKLSDVLQKEIDEGLVDIIEYIGQKKHQTDFFKDSYEMYKDKCRWISFYDFDEFLEIKDGNKFLTFPTYFTEERFGKCDVILINWLMYSDNDLFKNDHRPVNIRFTEPLLKSPLNRFVKSIIKGNIRYNPWDTDQTSHRPNHHLRTCDYSGTRAKTFNDVLKPPRVDKIYLKHFSTKTIEEYVINKMRRGYTSRFADKNLWVNNFFACNRVTKAKVIYFEKALNMTFHKYHYILEKRK